MGGFSYPDQFVFETDTFPTAAGAGIVGVFLVVYLFFMFLVSALSMVSYVLYSLGMYTMADRRGIRHSWLAWVPIGNLWILGSISDQYQYVVKGKVKNRRKLLLALAIGLVVAYIAWFVLVVVGAIASGGFSGDVAGTVAVMVLGFLVLMALAVTIAVYQYVCLYDLYSSSNPNNATLFLVLSIVFSVTMPFFVFACRKKDTGMPPRKQPAPEQVVVPTVEVVVDPNVVEKVVVPTVEPIIEEGFAQPEEFEEE